MKKSRSAKKTSQWYQRHSNDPHVKRARKEGKRSRAAFKLTEMLDSPGLKLKADATVVDLGAAPGSWCVELARRIGPAGLVVGIDLLSLDSIPGVTLIQNNFDSVEGREAVVEALSGRRVDWLFSDMAPEMSGNRLIDQMRMIGLNESALCFAREHLARDGNLLMKTFMGEGFDALRADLAISFRRVKSIKPSASRKSSSEFYLLGQEFRNQ